MPAAFAGGAVDDVLTGGAVDDVRNLVLDDELPPVRSSHEGDSIQSCTISSLFTILA
jgi:hypothetical protein